MSILLFNLFILFFFLLRQGFSVDLEPDLTLALEDKPVDKLIYIHLPLSPESWD